MRVKFRHFHVTVAGSIIGICLYVVLFFSSKGICISLLILTRKLGVKSNFRFGSCKVELLNTLFMIWFLEKSANK